MKYDDYSLDDIEREIARLTGLIAQCEIFINLYASGANGPSPYENKLIESCYRAEKDKLIRELEELNRIKQERHCK